jgi:hypothetical protein
MTLRDDLVALRNNLDSAVMLSNEEESALLDRQAAQWLRVVVAKLDALLAAHPGSDVESVLSHARGMAIRHRDEGCEECAMLVREIDRAMRAAPKEVRDE